MLFRIEPYDNHNLFIVFDREAARNRAVFERLLAWAKAFKEKQYLNNSVVGTGWRVPLNKETMDHIKQHFTETDYEVVAEANFMINYHEIATKLNLQRASKRWQFIFDGKPTEFRCITNIAPFSGQPKDGERIPFDHQLIAVESALHFPYFGYLMEMGTGKTPCAIWENIFYSLELQPGEQWRILIVCPKSLRQNWIDEFKRNWNPIIPYDIATVDGQLSAIDTLVGLFRSPAAVKVAIVSYDSASRMQEQLSLFCPHYIAFDESHFCKSSESNRYKVLKEIARLPCVRYRRILTGTPVANNLLDLWSQFELLEPGILGFNTFHGFKREFCNIVRIETGSKDLDKVVGFKNIDALKEAMARVSFIVKKEQCLTLPEKLYETRRIEMPPKMRQMYDAFLNEFRLAIDDTSVKTEFILVQMLKLSQICSGFVVGNRQVDDELVQSVKPIPGGDAKLIEMCDDVVDIIGTTKVIIWARFRYDIQKIFESLKNRGIVCDTYYGATDEAHRAELVKRFNNDSTFRCLIMQPGSGGVGLTLLGNQDVDHDRCKTAFFYSSDFSFGKRDQAEARNHRIGQRNPVLYRDYVYENSIEEKIAAALQSKRDLANDMKDINVLKDLLYGNKV